jgi:long-chain acyl-CoA synthetase
MKKRLFYAALAAKASNLESGHLTHALYDKLIFNKIKAALGMDHLRFMVSGSAPLASNVMVFFRCMLGVPVVEGYGQTEGAAGATLGHITDMASIGHVGGPINCCEIVLMDVPDMGYMSSDKAHQGVPCQGRGEICIRGPNVFYGYYKDEEKTREAIDEEGWLHSGDIGLWTMSGNLQIIDRKKNIFKLAQGEYVAPEKIELILSRSLYIAQCFVYGDSFQSYLVAIIVPDEEVVKKWVTDVQLEPEGTNSESFSMANLCKNEQLIGEIMNDVRTLSASNGLTSFETVRAVYLESEPFSVENGLMTPTFKLKRQQMAQNFKKQLDELYREAPSLSSKL